jgi:hypothetical protein
VDRTVSRGAVVFPDNASAFVSTSGKLIRTGPFGSVRFLGIGTPEPLLLQAYEPDDDTLSAHGFTRKELYGRGPLAEQVLALAKLHWGSIRSDVRLPVTTLFAQRVARLLSSAEASGLDLPDMRSRLACI